MIPSINTGLGLPAEEKEPYNERPTAPLIPEDAPYLGAPCRREKASCEIGLVVKNPNRGLPDPSGEHRVFYLNTPAAHPPTLSSESLEKGHPSDEPSLPPPDVREAKDPSEIGLVVTNPDQGALIPDTKYRLFIYKM